MQWYYNFLARRPYLLVLAIAVLCSACIIVSLTAKILPDFSDPTLGFEARGTVIGIRLTTWQNLLRETDNGGKLVADPNELLLRSEYFSRDDKKVVGKQHKYKHNRRRKAKRKEKLKERNMEANSDLSFEQVRASPEDQKSSLNLLPSWNGDNGVFHDYEITNDSSSMLEQQLNRSEHFEYGRNTSSIDEDFHRERIQTKKSTWRILKQASPPPVDNRIHISSDGYFCDSPAKQYSHFVLERVGSNASGSLFDLNGLLAMCQMQKEITNVPNYEQYCQKELLNDRCCRPWSLANYAALLANKSSCFDLNTEDVRTLQSLLLSCFEYFHDLKLSHAPAECMRENIVFDILYFLTDLNVIRINDSSIFLRYAMVFIPVAHTTEILPLFHEWEKLNLKNELVKVVAMDLGLENELFNELLLTDGWLVAFGGIFVMACMYIYTTSLFVTLMTCIAVLFSLGLAYFIYTLVFEMTFFPYMNLLAVVVIIGIGADDAFIFVKIWQCVLTERFTKSSIVTAQSLSVVTEHTETLQNLIALTLRHAALSMCVTSLTTAGAFYASYISSITAIKCFGVFAGTAVITNYLLMITWLPASVSIMERISACTACNKLQVQKVFLLLNKSINKFCQVFEASIITMVMNFSLLWVIVFTTVGICSAVVVLYYPGLQLPESAHFQLFNNKHPFEAYNSKFRYEFWFEKSAAAIENFKMPLRFVWGIEPIDDGDFTNPYSRGNLYFDNNFNISSKAAQVWLLRFCQHLRLQPFHQLTFGLLLPNCFIENFISFMNRLCIDGMDDSDRTPCCDISKFPYEPHVFEYCLPLSISSLYATPREFFIPGVAGPKFYVEQEENHSGNQYYTTINFTDNYERMPVKALVIEFESNVPFTTVYQDVKAFVHTVETWFLNELQSAPNEMKNGWFISELNFFDVQDTLRHDTLVAISVSMVASLVVLLLVTLNVLISLYAICCCSLTILTTVATLILLGWKLNVLESVTVSTAIGLAIDFSLHYSIHYRLSPTCERIAATQFSLSRIIGPTAMAALTTGFAGVMMLASNVLPYIQIGMFLVIVMTISWLYATFFLMSLLKLAGPQYNFMQFDYPRFSKRSNANGIKYYERKQSQVIASEQLLTPSSNSAIGDPVISEIHELESLSSNTNAIIKTISGDCSSLAKKGNSKSEKESACAI